jgi:signal transduction histidine kinase
VTPADHAEIALEMQTALRLADSAAERAATFVRGIKAQTRDLAPHEHRHFDAVGVIRETLTLLGHALRQRRCTTDFLPAAEHIPLHGSPGRLAQVVTNLVTNAIDASAPQGGPIELKLIRTANGVELHVSDQGSGIAPEHLPKIFDPMFTTKPFGEGTGLGLTIVHDIITGDFRGAIEVDSQPGRGTTFRLHFPHPQEHIHDS